MYSKDNNKTFYFLKLKIRQPNAFLPCPDFYPLGPFMFIFFEPSPYFLTVLVLANAASRFSPRNKIGHPAHGNKRYEQVLVESAHGIEIGTDTCVVVH